MRKVYMVDSENVSDVWLSILSFIQPEDRLTVFYTDNTPKISYDAVILLRNTDHPIEFIKCGVGGKAHNALDFQLVSELGYRIHEDPEAEYIIVSNDNGFMPVIYYWNDKGMHTGRYNMNYCRALEKRAQDDSRRFVADQDDEVELMDSDYEEAASEDLADEVLTNEFVSIAGETAQLSDAEEEAMSERGEVVGELAAAESDEEDEAEPQTPEETMEITADDSEANASDADLVNEETIIEESVVEAAAVAEEQEAPEQKTEPQAEIKTTKQEEPDTAPDAEAKKDAPQAEAEQVITEVGEQPQAEITAQVKDETPEKSAETEEAAPVQTKEPEQAAAEEKPVPAAEETVKEVAVVEKTGKQPEPKADKKKQSSKNKKNTVKDEAKDASKDTAKDAAKSTDNEKAKEGSKKQQNKKADKQEKQQNKKADKQEKQLPKTVPQKMELRALSVEERYPQLNSPEQIAKFFYQIFGPNDLPDAHNEMIAIYGSQDTDDMYYRYIKENIKSYKETIEISDPQTRFYRYTWFLLERAGYPEAIVPKDLHAVLYENRESATNLNTFRRFLTSRYGKKDGAQLYSILKNHIKAMIRIA